ncbi:hypothetical protein PQ751_10085 [Staphylococcus coagulans]|uniref:hypothetical protein n=1 Tax=Staphylococcus coagulans TaxID=74706 RepID=UPI001F4C2C46|nr:hypothetical protein [Staphylococcus coagulans]MDU9269117.1 hypothetical protein [Staphylococcus coagulans]MDU9281614.1 hypothetical protein [Staphylococcus coagulans]MDU9293351.1 hypothetical protein [Staphylococcus coagulans]MDU9305737.1 hypothetical protein [Staphylococcus coagulans]MDU9322789.1 hypothetical protein [Staphylococcus coagulans]
MFKKEVQTTEKILFISGLAIVLIIGILALLDVAQYKNHVVFLLNIVGLLLMTLSVMRIQKKVGIFCSIVIVLLILIHFI